VQIFGDDVSASALRSAAKLIGEDGVVYAIVVLPLPSQLSLEAGLEEERLGAAPCSRAPASKRAARGSRSTPG